MCAFIYCNNGSNLIDQRNAQKSFIKVMVKFLSFREFFLYAHLFSATDHFVYQLVDCLSVIHCSLLGSLTFNNAVSAVEVI